MSMWNNPAFTSYLKETEKKSIKSAANFVGTLLIALLAGQLVIGVILGVLEALGLLANDLNSNGEVVYGMLQYLLLLALPVMTVALFARRGLSPFPTRRVPRGTYPMAVFGGMALSFLANMIATVISAFFFAQGAPEPDLSQTYEPTAVNLLLNLLSSAVLPALFEEMAVRGYMLGALRPCGDKVAITVTAVLFGLIHGNIVQVPFAFVLGLVLGWLTVQTGSIWPAVVLHFSNNALSVILGWLEQFTGEGGELTTIAFMVCSLAGAIVFLAAFLHKRPYGEDLLRPVGNGVSCLTVKERVAALLTAPVFLIGGIVWLLVLLASLVPM